MSISHHYLMLKKWHPANKANLTIRYEKEQTDNDRKKREAAAKVELEKRREKYLFDKMVEMRDNGQQLNQKEMDLDFMYAVPTEVKELDKRRRSKQEDDDVAQFKAKYLNPTRVVTDIPNEVEFGPDKESDSEDEKGQPKDPRKNNPFSIFENAIKEDDGKLNFDRVENLVKQYQSRMIEGIDNQPEETQNSTEQPLKQFSSRAIEISKGLYLKTEAPIGGNIDSSLNTYVEASSEEADSDVEVMNYLQTLTEQDRDLLLRKLEEKENKPTTRRRHKHKHTSRDHKHSRESHSRR